MKAELIIKGRPITKKNHQQVVAAKTKTGKTFHRPIQSESYRNYETDCLWQLKTYRGPKFEGKIKLTCVYWMQDRRGWPDLVGLIQATQDILQKAGLIRDDQDVISLDGSRIAGLDKYNPRVEIEIEEDI